MRRQCVLPLAEADPPGFPLERSPTYGCTSLAPLRHMPTPERGEVTFASQPGNNKGLFPSSHWDKPSFKGPAGSAEQ